MSGNSTSSQPPPKQSNSSPLTSLINRFAARDRRSVYYGLIIALAFALGTAYFSSKRMLYSDRAEFIPAGRLALYQPILSFYRKYSRWPNDQVELRKFTAESPGETTLNPYQDITFKPEKDGSVRVKYIFKSIGGIESESFILTKP